MNTLSKCILNEMYNDIYFSLSCTHVLNNPPANKKSWSYVITIIWHRYIWNPTAHVLQTHFVETFVTLHPSFWLYNSVHQSRLKTVPSLCYCWRVFYHPSWSSDIMASVGVREGRDFFYCFDRMLLLIIHWNKNWRDV